MIGSTVGTVYLLYNSAGVNRESCNWVYGVISALVTDLIIFELLSIFVFALFGSIVYKAERLFGCFKVFELYRRVRFVSFV